ncbi:MAG: hypothetical protein KBC60_08630, partial [Haliscomenobacter sp.]|nr:hypothetical protein [Haliscomenobacter sp.]
AKNKTKMRDNPIIVFRSIQNAFFWQKALRSATTACLPSDLIKRFFFSPAKVKFNPRSTTIHGQFV